MTEMRAQDLCVGLLATVVVYAVCLARKQEKLPFPPGPKGYPLIGNILDDLSEYKYPWFSYSELSRKYNSDIIHLNMVGTHLIILNSRAAATELFEKRSMIYASRPVPVMLSELSGAKWSFGLREYGPFWKEGRALFRNLFQQPAIAQYYPDFLASSRALLLKFLQTPKNYNDHFRYMAARIILSTAYGIDVAWENDWHIGLAERALGAFSMAARPGVYLVDALPWLRHVPKWFPGATFQRDAARYKKDIVALPELTLQYVKKSMAEGTAQPSIASKYLQELEDSNSWTQEKEDALKGVLGAMYVAGTDTTVCLLESFVLAMVLHPEIQKKAQAAIGAAIGTTRLPDFDYYKLIPYIDALIYEVLRWKPIAPLAIPHSTTSEDVYNGYYIPKDALVIGNCRAILHDKAIYGEDAESFNPDRFMKGDKLNPDVPPPTQAFGFGRRICAGKDAAETSVWITITSLLAVFEFTGNGKTEQEYGEFESGIISYPPKFECEIKPRSADAAAMVYEAMQA